MHCLRRGADRDTDARKVLSRAKNVQACQSTIHAFDDNPVAYLIVARYSVQILVRLADGKQVCITKI